ncbi:helix-turn-helix domain-containing protein [Roseibium sp. MB-4]
MLLVFILARPEKRPETPLAERLRAVRRAIGDPDRDVLASKLEISPNSMSRYERGEREPTFSVFEAFNKKLGVNLNWLLTGAGEMFADASAIPSGPRFHTIRPDVFRAVGRLVTSLHKAEGITLPPDALFDEQSSAYNALIERAEDPSDADELTSLLPWLETRLKRQIATAKSSPGTEKREA